MFTALRMRQSRYAVTGSARRAPTRLRFAALSPAAEATAEEVLCCIMVRAVDERQERQHHGIRCGCRARLRASALLPPHVYATPALFLCARHAVRADVTHFVTR